MAAASPCFPSLPPSGSGTLRLGAILGILYISVGLAAVVGASASGWVFDQTGGYARPSRSAPRWPCWLWLRWRLRPVASVWFHLLQAFPEMIMHSSSSSGTLFAEDALLPTGWARNVLLSWDEGGRLAEVLTDVDPQSGEASEVDTAIRAAGR